MSTSNLNKYTSELLKDLTDDRKRNQARRRFWDGYNANKLSKLTDMQIDAIKKYFINTDTHRVTKCHALVYPSHLIHQIPR